MKWLLIPLIVLATWLGSSWTLAQESQNSTSLISPFETGSIDSVVSPIPSMGDQQLLILLVDFPDRPGLFTGQAWHQVFFGAEGFSAYFEENSYNQLRYKGNIVGIDNGMPVVNSNSVAYIRLPNPITYYTNDNYGFSVGSQYFPRNNGGVVYHALQALDAAGFNFSSYANPATHHIENLIVIFAGSTYAYTRDRVNSLEATAYQITHAGGNQFVAKGGQTADSFTFCPDQRLNLSGQIAYIGVCAHEHGHNLGMSDLYDFSNTTSGNGYFDLMAYGAFGAREGQRPYQLGAYSKQRFGWTQPTVLPVGTTTVSLAPAETSASMIKLYPQGNTNSKEYFLLENRQPLGFDQEWNGRQLCSGLIIWHIDETILDTYFYPNRVNTLPGAGGPPHQGILVVEADGNFAMSTPQGNTINYGECGDSWGVGRTWNASSNPSSSLWNGSTSGLSVHVEHENNGVLTLSITVASGTAATPTPLPTPTPTVTPTPIGTIIRGDGNGDKAVDAGDLTACALEIFDGDGSFWLDAPSGTFPGMPGCDANADTIIDAGDITCTALIIFNRTTVCGNGRTLASIQTVPSLAMPHLQLPSGIQVAVDRPISIPITLTTNGALVGAAAFELQFDPQHLYFDTTDQNADKIPDNLSFHLPPTFDKARIHVAVAVGTIKILVANGIEASAFLRDGALVTVTFTARGKDIHVMHESRLVFSRTTPPSLGDVNGIHIPVATEDGSVQLLPSLIDVRTYLPIVISN